MLVHCQSQCQGRSPADKLIPLPDLHPLSQLATVDNTHKDSYKRKIHKIQKRSDQIRRSTIDIQSQFAADLQPGSINHTRSVQQPIQEVQPRIGSKGSVGISQQHNRSTDSCQNYFEKKQNDRRKRTFNILKKFNPSLASEIVFKENLHEHKMSKVDMELRKYIDNAIIIQKYYRRYKAKQLFNQLLLKKLLDQEEKQQREQDILVEQWLIQQETDKLQREIEEKSRLFRFQIKRRVDAAIVIQRAAKDFLRKKNSGISTTQILERKQIETMDIEEQLMTFEKYNSQKQQDHHSTKLDTKLTKSQSKRSRTPRSLGATATNLSRGHLVNRMRQLQIETSHQRLMDCKNTSQVNEFGGSVTPLDMSLSQLLQRSILNIGKKKLPGQSKTPNNISMARKKSINSRVQGNNLLMSDEESKNELQRTGGGEQSAFSMSNEIINNSSGGCGFKLQKQGFALMEVSDKSSSLPKSIQQNFLQDTQNQLDNSLNNLFESLKQPLVHSNRFDLTQKINENFREMIQQCETIHELATPQLSCYEEEEVTVTKRKSSHKKKKQHDPAIYNKYLREENIKEKVMVQGDYQQLNIEQDNNSLLMLIPPSCSNDNTYSSEEGLGLLDMNMGSKNNKLNENDFPMTQLIKERTINNGDYQSTLNERYKYFGQLVNTFNAKEDYLKSLLTKREELIKSIQFYKQLFTNFNNMLENVNVQGMQSHRGKKRVVSKGPSSVQQTAREKSQGKSKKVPIKMIAKKSVATKTQKGSK